MSFAEIYEIAPTTVWVGVVVLGLAVGSFLNVVIYRLPVMMQNEWRRECDEYLRDQGQPLTKQTKSEQKFNLAYPNSRCPKCGHSIKPWQNIPVVSYVLLKGACANCKTKISPRYPIIEASTALLGALIFWHFGASPQALLGLVLLWSLISLTMIDADHYLLPDSITLPLMWLGIIANMFGTYTSLENSVIGAIAGYLSLWTLYWGFKLATGKEGMGYGDFKLLAALGAWMGWQYLPLIILLSSAVGAVLGIAAILLMGRDKAKPLPFGPYLAVAGFIAFIWGEELLQHYLQVMDFSR
ncbi:MAG: A24 family peptidase [Cellvibrionaceae bacterium]|nr:A24 family peptidase [Cellvibrionaceae bacterium]